MRTVTTSLVALIVLSSVAFAQPVPRYSEVRILLPERADLIDAVETAALDHVHLEKTPAGWAVDAVVSEADLARLAASRFSYEIVEEDVATAFAARASACPDVPPSAPAGFFFGSMGCYPTFDEIVAALDEMRATNPDIVAEKVSIGRSWQGRDLWMVRFSAAPDPDVVPEVMYTALHHAREPQSQATLMYFMYHLLAQYGTDPAITAMLQSRALYFMPVLNPDGYVYNQQIAPAGGGMWRKNRRSNGTSWGVDLNRNYSYEFNCNAPSTSCNPVAETYAGPHAFSEPETQALRLWLQGRQIGAAYNYHSFGNVWLHPFGFAFNQFTPDHARFTAISAQITRDNQYPFGTAANVLYPAAGDSDDYMYGDQTEIGKIFAFTPEIGRSSDGFWPSPSRIIPLAKESLDANIVLGWFVGPYPTVVGQEIVEAHSGNGHLDPGETGLAMLTLHNLGLEDLSSARARIVSADPAVQVETGPWSPIFTVGTDETVDTPPLTFSLGAETPLGNQAILAVEIEAGGQTIIQPLAPVSIGTPAVLFEDVIADASRWTLGQWGLSTTAYSPPFSLADSPAGNYPNNASNTLLVTQPLDLVEAVAPLLSFRARWDIEPSYDFVQVRASTDGASWTPLAGRFTRSGSGQGVQTAGEPGYDGGQNNWIREEIDLSAYEGSEQVYLQWRLRSDGSVTGAGFFLDNVRVESFVNGSTVSAEPSPGDSRLTLSAPFPNPTRDGSHVGVTIDRPGYVVVEVLDILGRRVSILADGPVEAGSHVLTWPGHDMGGRLVPAGVYILQLRVDGETRSRPLTILR